MTIKQTIYFSIIIREPEKVELYRQTLRNKTVNLELCMEQNYRIRMRTK